MKKTMLIKQLLFLSLIGMSLHCIAQNAQTTSHTSKMVLPNEEQTIPFLWKGASLNGRWEPHSAILVPVKLPSCANQFYMQFDLGSASSMFYGPALEAIKSRYPNATPTIAGSTTHISFTVGSMTVDAKEIAIKQFGNGINWKDSVESFIIGTIGTDLFDGRRLLIDYPGKKIVTGTELPTALIKKMNLVDLTYIAGRILLPALLRGKPQQLYFDTGSSAFALMTDKATSEQLAIPGKMPVAFGVNSWGKVLSAFTLPTDEYIEIATKKLPLQETTYVEGTDASIVKQMMSMGISGLTGNKLFIDSKLFLDLKEKKFGITQ